MASRTLFFIGLYGIRLSFPTLRGERFGDELLITNDRNVILDLIKAYKVNLGSVEFRFLTETCPNLIYSQGHAGEQEVQDVDAFLRNLTIAKLLKVQELQQALWLVKDNAALSDRGWGVVTLPYGYQVHNNYWASDKYKAEGTRDEVTFDREELRAARLIVGKKAPRYKAQEGKATALDSDDSRVHRFIYFVLCARSTDDAAMKIIHYYSGLEALTSSSNVELTHQISERVASLLEPPGGDRVALFNRLRRGYGIRSQAVHGSGFRTRTHDELRTIAIEIDEICRQLLLRIYTNAEFSAVFDLKDQAFSAHFNNLVLGGSSSSQTSVELDDQQ